MTIKNSFIAFALILAMSLGVVTPKAKAAVSESNGCLVFSQDLYLGLTSSDVISLQDFLRNRGLLSSNSTGYFGPLTYRAVQSFQASVGVSATGYFGPRTRAALQNASCGIGFNPSPTTPSPTVPGTGNPTPIIINPPYQGNLPQVSNVQPASAIPGTQLTLYGSGFTDSSLVIIGNGAIRPAVSSISSNKLTFTVPGVINPLCRFSAPECGAPATALGAGTYNLSVRTEYGTSNTIPFTLTSYDQSGNTPQVISVSPQSARVGNSITITGSGFTSSNKILLSNSNSAGWVNAAVGSINGTHLVFTLREWNNPNCAPNMACIAMVQQVTPGTYYLSVENEFGTSQQITLTVTDGQTTQAPVISGIDAPTQLFRGQTGTWTVRTNTNTSRLRYSIVWGDENSFTYSGGALYGYQSPATFTHTYSQTGTFTPRFTVTDENGQTATVSTTVQVIQ